MVATSYCTDAEGSGQVSMTHRGLRGTLAKNEVDFGGVVGGNGDVLAPSHGSGKYGALHTQLGDDVVELVFADHPPPFMPSGDFVLARGDLGDLEVAVPVGDRVIGVGCDHHLRVHPNVAGIATQVDESLAVHGALNDLILERNRQVVVRGTRHVHSVQSRITALHLQVALKRDQQNVGLVATTLLIQEPARFRELHRLALCDVLKKDHGVSHAVVVADNQALKVATLLALRITDLRIFVNLRGDQTW